MTPLQNDGLYAPTPLGWERHLQALHRLFFDTAGGACLLWVNPAQGDPFANERPFDARKVRVPIAHPRFDPAFAPYLIALQLDKFADAELFASSVQRAWHAWSFESLQAAQGQPICGWVRTTGTAAQLARHWGNHCHLHSHGQLHKLLRFHDPGVRQWLWPTLNPLQRRQLLGPAKSLVAFDRQQQLMFHEAAETSDPAALSDSQQLILNQQQWRDVSDYAVLHAALLRVQEVAQSDQSSGARSTVPEAALLHALAAATRYGIADAEDRILFATHAIEIGHDFHRHATMQAVWRLTGTGDYYGAALEEALGQTAGQLPGFLASIQ